MGAAARAEGGKMKELKAFVVTPHSTINLSLAEFIKKEAFSSVLDNLKHSSLSMYHTSTRKFLFDHGEDDYELTQKPEEMECGGSFVFEASNLLPNGFYEASRMKGSLRCTGCGTQLGTPFGKNDFAEILWQLLLKQSIPDLPTCNIIDSRNFDRGILSVYGYSLKGIYKKFDPERYLIGFDLLPSEKNLDTKQANKGLDSWLRFLFVEERERVTENIKGGIKKLLGPKSNYLMAGLA